MSAQDPMADKIIPIPLREDVIVRIFGIPHDMTPSEAAKLARVIEALAEPTP